MSNVTQFGSRTTGECVDGQGSSVWQPERSQATLQQLSWLVTLISLRFTLGYYQRVRGHYSPASARWELPGYNVGARSLWDTLHSELTQPSSAILISFLFLSLFQYDKLSLCEMSAVSQEEKEKKKRRRRKAPGPCLLLKISLVKFSPSPRQAAQTQGPRGVRGRSSRASKKRGGRAKQKHTQRANSPSKAGPGSPVCAWEVC